MLKQHNIPRESVVIMTKTFNPVSLRSQVDNSARILADPGKGDGPDKWGPAGMKNQMGSSRKVSRDTDLRIGSISS